MEKKLKENNFKQSKVCDGSPMGGEESMVGRISDGKVSFESGVKKEWE